jgi:hypothetical protein
MVNSLGSVDESTVAISSDDDDGWKIHWMHMRAYGDYMRVRIVDLKNITTNDSVGTSLHPAPHEPEKAVEVMPILRIHTLFSASQTSPRVVRICGQVVGRERFFRKGGSSNARTFLTLSDVHVTSAFDFFSCRSSPRVVHITFSLDTCGRDLVESCRSEVHQGDEVSVEGFAEVSPKGVAQINALSFTLLRKLNDSQWYSHLLHCFTHVCFVFAFSL